MTLMSREENVRVPRATNLVKLKKLLLAIEGETKVNLLLPNSNFSKIHFFEYLNLLKLLGWISFNNNFIILTMRGQKVQQKLNKNSDSDTLTDDDIGIFKKDFLRLNLVKNFLHNIFDADLSSGSYSQVAITKKDIEQKYAIYRNLSDAVAGRESRLIYNWLSNLGVIESLPYIYNYGHYILVYHLVGKEINPSFFNKIFPPFLNKLFENYKFPSHWIEIPLVRADFCIENNISKKQFDDLLIMYIEEGYDKVQLSTATSIRPEVEKEGLKMNNKIYFYINQGGI